MNKKLASEGKKVYNKKGYITNCPIDCPMCNEESFEKNMGKYIKEIETIWMSPKNAVEKKLETFEVLEKIDFGKISVSENKRTSILLKSRLHGELAKKYLKEYKKLTAEEFSKVG